MAGGAFAGRSHLWFVLWTNLMSTLRARRQNFISVHVKDQSEPQMFLREADRQRVTSDMRAAAPVQIHRPSFQIRIKTVDTLPESYSNFPSKMGKKRRLGRQPSEIGTDENANVPNIKGENKASEMHLHLPLCSSSVLEKTAAVETPQKMLMCHASLSCDLAS